MTTLREIAELAKVSITTVSKVLNGDCSKVSTETQQRIERIAREQHYVSNRIAKSLVEKKSHIIGILLPTINNPVFAEMASGVINLCETAGYSTMLFNTEEREDREISYLNMLISYHADGVVVVGNERTAVANMNRLNHHGTPYVMLDTANAQVDYRVSVDDFSGVYHMVKQLVQFGHRKIAFISGQGYISDEDNPRLSGYRQALTDHHIAVDPLLIEMGNYDAITGYTKTIRLLSRRLGITAIVCGNDLIATGAYRALRENHLLIPEDVSVVGYDHIFVADIMDPPLSTVKAPVYDMGVAAASMLMKRIDRKPVPNPHIVFEPTLMMRNSVSVPKAREEE